jgi:AcrR family transcriptional regulator
MVKQAPDSANPSRKRILEAARAEFSEKGFDGARVDSIAQRAEVNKALIYYYFKSKEELLRELLRGFLQERLQSRAEIPDDPTRDLPIRIGLRDVELLFEKRDILRIALMEDLKSAGSDAPEGGIIARHWLEGLRESRLIYQEAGYDFRLTPRVVAATYFFHLIPKLAFATFGESLAKASGCKLEKLRGEFMKLVAEVTQAHGDTVFRPSTSDPEGEIALDGSDEPASPKAPVPQDHLRTDPRERAALVAKHMPNGRLETFPLKEKARLALIEHISESFDRRSHYTEREVDAILKPLVADHSKARRYLVDYGFLRRTADGSRYWTWDGEQ